MKRRSFFRWLAAAPVAVAMPVRDAEPAGVWKARTVAVEPGFVTFRVNWVAHGEPTTWAADMPGGA